MDPTDFFGPTKTILKLISKKTGDAGAEDLTRLIEEITNSPAYQRHGMQELQHKMSDLWDRVKDSFSDDEKSEISNSITTSFATGSLTPEQKEIFAPFIDTGSSADIADSIDTAEAITDVDINEGGGIIEGIFDFFKGLFD
ncbi:hypothetical protein DFR58_105158 [Anaerobacterium chartisolvens]|uniref:Uncharacterized protein n=1 Tax=Anaerobacterium chartisolvens TaxID=1297424 RepID=A0A369BFC0_9FIRM|nr:hypothetical protein [Anaerobacterium chartisolvens]RCX18394.1 hypothetical protein DFR58_105158 [Anaerobacterium chartisolvens]